ncbi:MAG: glycosyltransferase, partial [Candidatus Ornithospirochaeta sp.]
MFPHIFFFCNQQGFNQIIGLAHIQIVFVDDGSKDNTVELIENMQKTNEAISLIKLSRNFGKEAAMSAAIDLV